MYPDLRFSPPSKMGQRWQAGPRLRSKSQVALEDSQVSHPEHSFLGVQTLVETSRTRKDPHKIHGFGSYPSQLENSPK